jgi:hypothetical protein
MNKPTPEQLARLPKWASSHIAHLTRTCTNLQNSIDAAVDSQTPSPIWVDEMVHNMDDPVVFKKRFVQSDSVCFLHKGVHLTVCLIENSITLSWNAETNHGCYPLCFVPTSFQQARIQNLAHNDMEYARLIENKKRAERKRES